MKLFKMIGQILQEPIINKYPINISIISNNSIINISQNNDETVTNIKNESLVINTPPNNLQNTTNSKNYCNAYVLFAVNGQTLLILDSKVKKEIKLFGIDHPEKNNSTAKKATIFLNDISKKKTVYLEVFNNNNKEEYKVYLDKEKKDCINDLLISANLHNSLYFKTMSNHLETPPTYQKDTKKNNTGIFIKEERVPYLYEKKAMCILRLENFYKYIFKNYDFFKLLIFSIFSMTYRKRVF